MPLAPSTSKPMFARNDRRDDRRLATGETDEVECKTSFGFKHPTSWLRAIAALANNRGGYLFLGIADKDETGLHRVVGLGPEHFEEVDPVAITRLLRATFDPTPRFEKGVVEVGGKRVGVLWVEQHPARPIIARVSRDDIRDGDIFFRYPGQSARISHADLRAMLDARDAQARADILPMVRRLLDLGPSRAMVADLKDGHLTDGKRIVELDPETVGRLKFIKEGEFDEVEGAPTLRLIGDVVTAVPSGVSTRKGL